VTVFVLRADARHLPLPDRSVDLICTSPPYYGLRSYTDGGEHYDGQLGSEPTPAAYVDALVACTAEWVRVLKPSGSMFVNLGDKYSTGNSGQSGLAELGERWAGGGHSDGKAKRRQLPVQGLPPKSLLGLPWRYALACMDRLGLILRSEIIWAKPNGLPESVTDRVRRSHEQVFHFTVRPRYYSAVDEIREVYSDAPDAVHHRRKGIAQNTGHPSHAHNSSLRDYGVTNRRPAYENPLGKLPGSVWDDTIWRIPSQPFIPPKHLGDHFAAFPMELPRRLILGWSPPGVCVACGEGRRPVVHDPSPVGHVGTAALAIHDTGVKRLGATSQLLLSGGPRQKWKAQNPTTITGYACACPSATAPTRPALVVDPFGGTGTTALIADAYGRHGITIDRSMDYTRLARWRTTDPAQRAAAMQVPKPPPVSDDQQTLFDAS
jgi:DNA modification methylase